MDFGGCWVLLWVAALLFGAACADETPLSISPNITDVGKANITSFLRQLPPDSHVLIEFYASWCPACRAFKPTYEAVANFLAASTSDATKVHVFRLDCAVDPDTCGEYKVQGFPTMYLGAATDVAAISLDALHKFDYNKHARTEQGLIQWISQTWQMDLEYTATPGAKPEAAKTPKLSRLAASTLASHWQPDDVQAATEQLYYSIASSTALHDSKHKRQALLDLLDLWAEAHPVPACRDGSTAAARRLPHLWPAGSQTPKASLLGLAVCGARNGSDGASSGRDLPWVACRGSAPEHRGFTCGLWLLLHTCARNLPDANGGALFMSALRGFGTHFFQCEVCRTHFQGILARPDAFKVVSRRDAVLWLWRVHNEVNKRLANVESKHGGSSSGDPLLPKVQWPPRTMCSACHTGLQDGEWDEAAVFSFLDKWYGDRGLLHKGRAAAAQLPTRAAQLSSWFRGTLALSAAALALVLYRHCWVGRQGGQRGGAGDGKGGGSSGGAGGPWSTRFPSPSGLTARARHSLPTVMRGGGGGAPRVVQPWV